MGKKGKLLKLIKKEREDLLLLMKSSKEKKRHPAWLPKKGERKHDILNIPLKGVFKKELRTRKGLERGLKKAVQKENSALQKMRDHQKLGVLQKHPLSHRGRGTCEGHPVLSEGKIG